MTAMEREGTSPAAQAFMAHFDLCGDAARPKR